MKETNSAVWCGRVRRSGVVAGPGRLLDGPAVEVRERGAPGLGAGDGKQDPRRPSTDETRGQKSGLRGGGLRGLQRRRPEDPLHGHGQGGRDRGQQRHEAGNVHEDVRAAAGDGPGSGEIRVVFVFETPAAFQSFVTSGKELGADAMAAAKNKTQGGAQAGAVTVVGRRVHVSGRHGGRHRGRQPHGRQILQGQGTELTGKGRYAAATGEKGSEGAPAGSARICMAPLHDPVLSDRFRIRRAPSADMGSGASV